MNSSQKPIVGIGSKLPTGETVVAIKTATILVHDEANGSLNEISHSQIERLVL